MLVMVLLLTSDNLAIRGVTSASSSCTKEGVLSAELPSFYSILPVPAEQSAGTFVFAAPEQYPTEHRTASMTRYLHVFGCSHEASERVFGK
jgi:hypothetical protein